MKRNASTNRTFHFKINQPLQLDRVFHGELASEIIDKTIHTQAHRLSFGQPALLHIKDLLSTHFGHAGLMLDRMSIAANRYRWISIRATIGVNQQCVTLRIVFATLEVFRNMDDPAIGAPPLTDR